MPNAAQTGKLCAHSPMSMFSAFEKSPMPQSAFGFPESNFSSQSSSQPHGNQLPFSDLGHNLNSAGGFQFPTQPGSTSHQHLGSSFLQDTQHTKLLAATDESPSLAQLLKYPAVQVLYDDLSNANRRVVQALELQGQLQQEILRLTGMLQSEMGSKYEHK